MKALACELPASYGLQLGRFTRTELHRLVVEHGVTDVSASTIWRWLHERRAQAVAAALVDLPTRPRIRREGRPGARPLPAPLPGPPAAPRRVGGLRRREVAAASARPATRPCRPLQDARRWSSSTTAATLAYLAAWDVHHANLFDRVEATTGIKPFGRLVAQVMSSDPYASARTVFWIVGNGSSHAGQASVRRLEEAYPNLRLIHLPI